MKKFIRKILVSFFGYYSDVELLQRAIHNIQLRGNIDLESSFELENLYSLDKKRAEELLQWIYDQLGEYFTVENYLYSAQGINLYFISDKVIAKYKADWLIYLIEKIESDEV